MPAVTVNPLNVRGNEYVTQFTGTATNTPQTYTFDKSQDIVSVKNNGTASIFATFNGRMEMIAPGNTLTVNNIVSEVTFQADKQNSTFSVTATENRREANVEVLERAGVGDSVTDDTANVLAAINKVANAGGGTVHFAANKTYRVSGTIAAALATNGKVKLAGGPGSRLDVTNNSTAKNGTPAIRIGGTTRGSAVALGADITKGDYQFSCSISALPGEILLIKSTTLYNPQRPSYIKGEMVEVESVSGGVVTVKGVLQDSYLAATTTVQRIWMPTVEIEGIQIVANEVLLGLQVNYARDVSLKDISISGALYGDFYVQNCYGGVISNCTTTDCYDPVDTYGTSYALCIASSQNISVIGGRYLGGRHGIAHGGSFPCRNISYFGVEAGNYTGSSLYSFDAHGNVESITVESCTIRNGIALQAINAKVTNNTVYAPRYTSGIQLVPEMDAGTIICNNNDVIVTSTVAASAGYGITVNPAGSAGASVTINKLIISGNTVTCNNRGIQLTPGGKVFKVKHLIVKDNTVNSSSAEAFYMRGNFDYSTIEDNVLETAGNTAAVLISHDGSNNTLVMDDLLLEHNTVRSASGKGIHIFSNNKDITIKKLSLVRNDVVAGTQALHVQANTITIPVKVDSFELQGGTYVSSTSSPMTLEFGTTASVSPHIKINGSRIGAAAASQYGLRVYGGKDLIMRDVELYGVANAYTNIIQNYGKVILQNVSLTNFTNTGGLNLDGDNVNYGKPTHLLQQNVTKTNVTGTPSVSGTPNIGSYINAAGTVVP